MFIGKIVQFGNQHNVKVFGFIRPYGDRNNDVYFHIDDIVSSRLKKMLFTFGEVGVKVAFDVIEDPLEPLRKVAINIRLAYECDPKTIRADINKSQINDPNVIQLLNEMDPVKEPNVQDEDFQIDNLLSIHKWTELSEKQKVETVLFASKYLEAISKTIVKIKEEIYDYEIKSKNLTVISVLAMLIGGTFKPEEPNRRLWFQQGHRCLVKALTESFQKSKNFSESLNLLLPNCLYDTRIYCNARNSINGNLFCNQHFGCEKIKNTKEITEKHLKNVSEKKETVDLRDYLINLHFSMSDLIDCKTVKNVIDEYEYPFRIASFANRLNKIHEYLQCRVCGKLLYPDLSNDNSSSVYSLIYFTCLNKRHSSRIYINHCYRCKHIIDSRECAHKTKDILLYSKSEYWVCMRCGGSDELESGKYCPSCKKALTKEEFYNGVVKCSSCGHDGQWYGLSPYFGTLKRHNQNA